MHYWLHLIYESIRYRRLHIFKKMTRPKSLVFRCALPFELRALEAVLHDICSQYNSAIITLISSVDTVLDILSTLTEFSGGTGQNFMDQLLLLQILIIEFSKDNVSYRTCACSSLLFSTENRWRKNITFHSHPSTDTAFGRYTSLLEWFSKLICPYSRLVLASLRNLDPRRCRKMDSPLPFCERCSPR